MDANEVKVGVNIFLSVYVCALELAFGNLWHLARSSLYSRRGIKIQV